MSIHRHPLSLMILPLFCVVLAGCPPQDTLVGIQASPAELDFGSDQVELTFYVTKLDSVQSMPPFTVSSEDSWIELPECLRVEEGCVSTGPADRIPVRILVNRVHMVAGNNAGTVVVQAAGLAPQKVEIKARAAIVPSFVVSDIIPYAGDPVTFIDSSMVVAGEWTLDAAGYVWDFGDGTGSTVRNPASHVYEVAGIYTVSLSVTAQDASGASLIVTGVMRDVIVVSAREAPIAAFSTKTPTPNAGNANILFADESIAGTAPITDWEWDFGDGGSSLAQNPNHTYEVAGTYTVSLTVTSEHGRDTLTELGFVKVGFTLPTAAFSASANAITAGDSVAFTDQSQQGTAPIETWHWDFGDGEISGDESPVHTYVEPGSYDVTLAVDTIYGSDTTDTPFTIDVAPM